jgi:hypothetical protein
VTAGNFATLSNHNAIAVNDVFELSNIEEIGQVEVVSASHFATLIDTMLVLSFYSTVYSVNRTQSCAAGNVATVIAAMLLLPL